jgi:hypothetical protein
MVSILDWGEAEEKNRSASSTFRNYNQYYIALKITNASQKLAFLSLSLSLFSLF